MCRAQSSKSGGFRREEERMCKAWSTKNCSYRIEKERWDVQSPE
jgi:hypothetical protein